MVKLSNQGHLGIASLGEGLYEMTEIHPAYLDCFLRLHHSLLDEGPLPQHYRHYIAIMAASRHQCSFVVEEQKTAYLESGGPETWLHGLQFAPHKLQVLHNTNKLLAHRPWLYEKAHVQHLLKNSWSLSELAQAVCILTQFHAICCIVYGAGIEAVNGEQISPCVATAHQTGVSGSPSSSDLSEGGVEMLLKKMETLSSCDSNNDIPEEKANESFEHLKYQTADIANPSSVDGGSPNRFEHISPDADFTYVDFRRRKEKTLFPTMKIQDISWEDHGYSLLRELYSEAGELLDDKFQTAYSLTYFTCGNITQVNTSPFRTAIWNYLHCLYGIKHDNYDYRRVDQLLDRSLKHFLKTVTCFPERLLPTKHSSSLMNGFLDSEKIHVLILVVEARLQAELLYALRAIGDYLM